MTSNQPTCPATRSKIVELYFLEHRAKLIDIASFLDRVDRAPADGQETDFRVEAFRRALAILDDPALHDPALFDGLEEFREHLGGRLTITLLERIGRPVDVHEIDRDRMAHAIGQLASMTTRERNP